MDNRIDLRPGGSFYYYQVVGVLGSGAHGTVFEIRHPHTGDSFALKTIYAADRLDRRRVERALSAAKGNYKIEHRHVVCVHDLNMESDGLVWMRTELLKGHTLHDLRARQGALSLPFSLAAGVQAAHGLHALHENKMIHRDVKPSNLFYTWERNVKVLDLSLVKIFGDTGFETTAGRRVGMGTPAYAAPEQLEGMRPDVRCDVYGLGMTLWELLAGAHPYATYFADGPQLIQQQLTVLPPPLSTVAKLPARVDDVLARAIAKDPADRYSSMMEMARALAELGAWAASEVRARRLIIDVPSGEPPIPGDANTWRDYRGSEPTPTHPQPPPAPTERVVVTPSPVELALRALAATEPLVPAAPAQHFAATQPLSLPSAGPTLAGTAILPASGAGKIGVGEAVTVAEPVGVVSSGPRDTPAAITHTRRGSRAAQLPRRAPWIFVMAALGFASLGGVFAVIWFHGHHAHDEEASASAAAPLNTVTSSSAAPHAALHPSAPGVSDATGPPEGASAAPTTGGGEAAGASSASAPAPPVEAAARSASDPTGSVATGSAPSASSPTRKSADGERADERWSAPPRAARREGPARSAPERRGSPQASRP